MIASCCFIWQGKDKLQHAVPANWGAASTESAQSYRIQSNVMAVILGLPYFDNYLYSLKLPFLNSSFHHDLFFMHSWDWELAEIRYCLFRMCHEHQVFKIYGGWELASHWLSLWVATGIQILCLRALLMDIGSHNLFYNMVFGCPNIHVTQNVVMTALEALWI